MRKCLSLLIPCLLLAFAAHAQGIASCNADQLMSRLRAGRDTTFVVNFWATWCVPCVKELPEFDELQRRFAGQKVKVLLVSFDFEDAYPRKLREFIVRKKLQPEVLWFRETDADSFIPKIDVRWSGALPATIIMRVGADFKRLIERPITAGEVAALVAESRR